MSPVRRVRRVIRKIDPWTVLKVTLLLNAIGALAFVLGSIIFWSVFVNAGIPEKISEFAEKLTLSFEPDGPTYFRVVLLLSIIWTVGTTGLLTVSALLYNLISDVVGGIEVVVLEETLVVPAQAAQRAAAPARPVRSAWFRRKPAAEATPPPATGPPRPAPVPPPATQVPEPVVEPAPRPVPVAADAPTAETPAPVAAEEAPIAEEAVPVVEAALDGEVIPVEAAEEPAAEAEVEVEADEPIAAREASRA